MTPAMRNLFALADSKHMMVVDLMARMPLSEYINWIRYHTDDETMFDEGTTTDEDILKAFGIV